MTIDHPKFCIHTVLQLVGLTTEKLFPTALHQSGEWAWIDKRETKSIHYCIIAIGYNTKFSISSSNTIATIIIAISILLYSYTQQ